MLNFIIGFLTAPIVFGILCWRFCKMDEIHVNGEKVTKEWVEKNISNEWIKRNIPDGWISK